MSCFLDKLFLALGAGNGDLTLSPGDPNLLAAAGTVKIPMLPILQLFKNHQKFSVFLIPLIGIAG